MSLLENKHINMILKMIKKLLNNKADKSELEKLRKEAIKGLNQVSEEIFGKLSKKIMQPDWRQNDTTSPDFVKNRTHFSTTVTIFDINVSGLIAFNPPVNLVANKQYIMVVNGVEHNVISRIDDSNGLPYVDIIIGGVRFHSYAIHCDISGLSEGESWHIVLKEEVVVKKLDAEYIPAIDWDENILNKPFGEIEEEYVFVDIANAPISGQAAAILNSNCEYDMIPGEIYTVTINGISKEIECTLYNGYGSPGLLLDENGVWDNESIYQMNGYIFAWNLSRWEYGSSVKVVGRGRGIKKIDTKYIPDDIARTNNVENIKNEFNNIKGIVFYGICNTQATTKEKVVRVYQANNLSFSLKQGVLVCIKFNYTNTTSTMTLNVNNTGAKNIKLVDDTTITTNYWQPYSYVTFIYDGNYWNIISISNKIASTSNYGLTKLSSSISNDSDTVAATSSAVKKAYNLANSALSRVGGTMIGDLTLKGDPTLGLHAASKQYVDNTVDKCIGKLSNNIPDWNQNISGAAGYIKNRPFYDGTIYTHTFDGVTEFYVLGTDFCAKLYEKKEEAKYIINGNELTFKTDYGNYNDQSWSYSVTDGTSEYIIYACASNNNGIDKIQVITMGGSLLPATISFSVEDALHKLDEKYIPDSINERIDEKVTTPNTASVGQTLVVKSVDETGRPTDWETVNLPKQMIVNITIDENNNPIVDKTFDEIKEAYDSGIDVICSIYDGISFRYIYHLNVIDNDSACFSNVSVSDQDVRNGYFYIYSDNTVNIIEEKGYCMPWISNIKVGNIIRIKEVDNNGMVTSFESVDPWVLIDETTSKKYRLSVVDGKLTMKDIESEV